MTASFWRAQAAQYEFAGNFEDRRWKDGKGRRGDMQTRTKETKDLRARLCKCEMWDLEF